MITAGMTAAEIAAIAARLDAKITKAGPDECWIWTGSTGQYDHPTSSLKRKALNPRRFIWELTHGEPVPAKAQMGVTCGVSLCLNPTHLYLRPFGDDEARFWSLVRKADSDACWEWNGPRTKRNYGMVTIARQKVPAHRAAWELTSGPIPAGLFVCHRCDNPPCVRPDHLFLGTALENNQDMWAKNRGWRGGARKRTA